MFVFQHEKTGLDNDHIQARVNRSARIRTLSFAKKMSEETGIGLKYVNVSPTQNPTQNFDYTMKSESRVSGPWSNRDTTCLMVTDPLEQIELYQWQDWILNSWFDKKGKTEYNKNGRKILFVLDVVGNTGKSSLCKHCAISRQKDVCILPVSGTALQLSSTIIDAGPFPYYILDLPRCKPQKWRSWIQDILHVVEQLQNGLIINSMYGKYKRLVMNNPQIVIFSNWHINELLSLDRYLYLNPNRMGDFNKKITLYSSDGVPDVPGHLIKGDCEHDRLTPTRIGSQDVEA
jgi:hypothetical protein